MKFDKMHRDLILFVIMTVGLLGSVIIKSTYMAWYTEQRQHYEKPLNWLENCQFPTRWDMTYIPVCQRSTRRISKPWCVDHVEQQKQLVDLGTHMRLFTISENRHGVVAMDFDIPYRIAFLRQLDKLLINPEITKSSAETKDCIVLDDSGKELRIPKQYQWILVTYLDVDFIKREVRLDGLKSCVMQSLFYSMNNRCLDSSGREK